MRPRNYGTENYPRGLSGMGVFIAQPADPWEQAVLKSRMGPSSPGYIYTPTITAITSGMPLPVPQYGDNTISDRQISYTGDPEADAAAGAPGAQARSDSAQASRTLMWFMLGAVALAALFAVERARR